MARMGTDGESRDRINSLTQQVIGCAFKVGTALGPGFLEKVYENALAHELRKAGLNAEQQRRLTVWYDGVVVGEYVAEVVVEDAVLVELKAARAIDAAHEAQCINGLTATRMPVCLLLNFSARVQVRRFVGPNAPDAAARASTQPPRGMTWAEVAEFGDPGS